MRALLAAATLALAGCLSASPGPAGLSGTGSDPSLPGIVVSGDATLEDGAWRVAAEATNTGTRTYMVDTYCLSPLGLEARAEGGEEWHEVVCHADTPPIDFRPGDTVARSWTVEPKPLGWTGEASLTVTFRDADGVGQVKVPLR